METTTRLDSRHKPTQKLIRMRKVGKGYGFIFDSYAMVLIYFFTNTVRRYLLPIRRILAKLSTVFHVVADKIGEYISSRPLLLRNLLSNIGRTRTFVNMSSYLLLHSCTVRERMVELAKT